jgi:hypothetical protein
MAWNVNRYWLLLLSLSLLLLVIVAIIFTVVGVCTKNDTLYGEWILLRISDKLYLKHVCEQLDKPAEILASLRLEGWFI